MRALHPMFAAGFLPVERWVPFTPGDSMLADCEATTAEGAWRNLLASGAGGIYGTREALEDRGYIVERIA